MKLVALALAMEVHARLLRLRARAELWLLGITYR